MRSFVEPWTTLAELTVPGTEVWCQFWGRDDGYAPPNDAALSNALRYSVGA